MTELLRFIWAEMKTNIYEELNVNLITSKMSNSRNDRGIQITPTSATNETTLNLNFVKEAIGLFQQYFCKVISAKRKGCQQCEFLRYENFHNVAKTEFSNFVDQYQSLVMISPVFITCSLY